MVHGFAFANPQGISARGLALISKRLAGVQPLITHRLPLEKFDEA